MVGSLKSEVFNLKSSNTDHLEFFSFKNLKNSYLEQGIVWDFLGFWDPTRKKIPIPKIPEIPGFFIWDFFWDTNPKNPGIWEMGFGIPEKSHPKATSAFDQK